jgi:putative ABC transport system substrate-binding protein
MRRREFLGVLSGAAAAWPLVAQAQQTAMPVIGFMSGRSPEDSAYVLSAFRQGFWPPIWSAEGWLFSGVGGDVSALAAKRATATIPVVFGMGGDPVKAGLVASSIDPMATSRALPFGPMRSSRSGWVCCGNLCRGSHSSEYL